jgi:sec-independent protein translocase protein TatA
MGFLELLTIAFIILLVFGSNRLPGVARGIGKGIKNFKDAVQKPSSPHKDD